MRLEYEQCRFADALFSEIHGMDAENMVSMFHMDGDRLLMTHYCGAGNQPFMKFKPGKDADVLFFDFVRGSNMKPGDMHMHRVTFTFDGPDHIVSEWQTFKGGKPGDKATFDFRRVKS